MLVSSETSWIQSPHPIQEPYAEADRIIAVSEDALVCRALPLCGPGLALVDRGPFRTFGWYLAPREFLKAL